MRISGFSQDVPQCRSVKARMALPLPQASPDQLSGGHTNPRTLPPAPTPRPPQQQTTRDSAHKCDRDMKISQARVSVFDEPENHAKMQIDTIDR